MCIMEVRPGQRLSTIAQAMAHNTNTVRGDMDMLSELCQARGHNHVLDKLATALTYLDGAYQEFLEIFADELRRDLEQHGDTADPHYHHGTSERPASDIPNLHNHDHEHPHSHAHITHVDREMIESLGIDRNVDPELAEAAERACARAERFETRTT